MPFLMAENPASVAYFWPLWTMGIPRKDLFAIDMRVLTGRDSGGRIVAQITDKKLPAEAGKIRGKKGK